MYNISDAGAVDREFFVFLLMYLFWRFVLGSYDPSNPLRTTISCGAAQSQTDGYVSERKHPCILVFQWPCTPKPKHKKQRASMDVAVFSATFKLARAYWYTSYTYTRQQRLQCFFLGLGMLKPYVS
jgi:hypothetical protein